MPIAEPSNFRIALTLQYISYETGDLLMDSGFMLISFVLVHII